MRNFIYLGAACAAFALSGCASNGTAPQPANYAAIVGMIQTDWPVVEAAANTYAASPEASASAKAAIAKAEADGNQYVAALSATSAPTSIQAVLSDMQVLVTLPGGLPGVSGKTQEDINTGLSLLLTGAQIAATLAPLL